MKNYIRVLIAILAGFGLLSGLVTGLVKQDRSQIWPTYVKVVSWPFNLFLESVFSAVIKK